MTETMTAEQRRQVAQDLRDTASYIEEHGWAQEQFETDDGAVCALGGLRRVTGVKLGSGLMMVGEAGERYTRAKRSLKECISSTAFTGPFLSIIEWNDDEEQTREGVLSGFRGCADRVESEEVA